MSLKKAFIINESGPFSPAGAGAPQGQAQQGAQPNNKMSAPDFVEAVQVLQGIYPGLKQSDPEGASTIARLITYLNSMAK